MSLSMLVAFPILLFAAAFHLYWALGGKVGFSVSLPMRDDGTPVMAHRIGWWRPAAALVGLGLLVLTLVAACYDLGISLPPGHRNLTIMLRVAAVIFIARALVPTPWTGLFKTRRHTRWARYDTRFYSPLILLLGICLLFVSDT